MKFLPNHIYHVYNQGNNQETIFKTSKDYLLFLKKVEALISPECEIMAYCLMPNHFHFLVMATERSAEPYRLGNIDSNQLSNGFRLLLSEYAQDFNKANNRSGSLFRQKTKAKDLAESDQNDASLSCFNYIHNNPSSANLVKMSKDWEFSSLKDYLELRDSTMCNQRLAYELSGIDNLYMREVSMHF